ncbi:hypothetical protein [Aliamphritea hakodatensis]|uniref:hypothetical protein n=1 Tax=Aliamphritea hakodatensis TaxID=2895352 RepID=UPI0022FD791B|nr:hypothetical protein [Aliamphritea hakodatensis]
MTQTSYKHKEFSELSGLDRKKVKNLLDGNQRFNEEHIHLITTAFPQYKMWFVFGQTQPETEQTSPELEEGADSTGETGTNTR